MNEKMYVVNVAVKKPHDTIKEVFAVENETFYMKEKPDQQALDNFVKDNADKGVLGAMFVVLGEFTPYADEEQTVLLSGLEKKEKEQENNDNEKSSD